MKTANARGFTLIEILVVIAISTMLLALAAGTFTRFFYSSVLNSEIDSLVSVLRLARSKAMVEENDKAYQAVINAGQFRVETAGGGTVVETHLMSSQAVITSAPVTIVFDKITGTTASCPSGCTITMATNPTSGITRSVVVSNQGLITVP